MGGAEYSAKVIGVDQDKDVAVLEVRCVLLVDWSQQPCPMAL